MIDARYPVLRRAPMLAFAVLTYALSWAMVPLAQGSLLPHGPTLAAILLIALTEGRAGLRAFWQRCTKWNAGWWYLAGPAFIVTSLLIAYGASLLLGARFTNTPHLPQAAVLLNLLLLGGMWEEPGWTGYALPTLQGRYAGQARGALAATLLTGLMRAVWHLPLVVYGHIAWYDALFYSLALQVVFSWIYNRSKGSVPAVMLAHLASNVLVGYTMLQAYSGQDRTVYYILFVAAACLVALLILWRTRLRLGLAPEGAAGA